MEKKEQSTRQKFLLTFFKNEKYYVEVNGFWLVKQWNPVLKRHHVAIYTEESFGNMREFLNSRISPDKLHIQSLFPKVG